jgi:hypothetical protein
MATVVARLTFSAVTVKDPVAEPCKIVTEDGTVAAALLELASVTTIPPIPAGADIITVPAAVCPPESQSGFRESPLRVMGGFTVRLAVTLAPA